MEPLVKLLGLTAFVATTGLTMLAPAVAAAKWVAPLNPITVLAHFDPPPEPWLTGHRGVDIAAPVGATVRSAGEGRVTFVGAIANRGIVTVSHGQLRTTYEPVQATVVTGDYVMAGQIIGTVSLGGHCDSRCLHWGLLSGKTYLDPLLLLNRYPPVLKTPKEMTGSRASSTNVRSKGDTAPRHRTESRAIPDNADTDRDGSGGTTGIDPGYPLGPAPATDSRSTYPDSPDSPDSPAAATSTAIPLAPIVGGIGVLTAAAAGGRRLRRRRGG